MFIQEIYSDQIFVFFASEQRVDIAYINEIIQLIRQHNSTKVIIIIRHSITPQAKEVFFKIFLKYNYVFKLIAGISNKITIDLIPEAELVGNITDTDLMPEGMTMDEKSELLSQ